MAKDSREHILEVSLTLFLQKSFKAVTMKELVTKTGLSKGAFYHYFESKEQLFEEVVKRFLGNQISHDFDRFNQDSLKAFYEDYIQNSFQKLEYMQQLGKNEKEKNVFNHYILIFDAIAQIPSFRNFFNEQDEMEIKIWEKVIRKAKKNGEIQSKASNRNLARMFIFSGDGTALRLILLNKIEERKKFIKELKNLWDDLYRLLKV